MALIIPKCNAESETLDLTLKVYYDAQNWVTNADLIDRLSTSLITAGIETQKKEPQSYTKKTQVLSYYGFIEWEDPDNTQSKRRITATGRKFYELRKNNNTPAVQALLVDVLKNNTFGRNVLGCDSDSDLEAPNIFVKSTMILGHLTNKEFAYIVGNMELEHKEFADVLFEVLIKRERGIQVVPSDAASKWADPKPILALADWGLFTTQKQGASKYYYLHRDVIETLGNELALLRTKNTEPKRQSTKQFFSSSQEEAFEKILNFSNYITAIKTKPFLLLAGISGTGKSRIVREFAFKSCPKCLQDKDGTTPGNYCMIEVKPNWHDSTELLGYYSRLGKAGYQFTKFVKFLVKAKMFPTVPFFVCLDEMNLAPVEQYFAEILSILETRKHPKNVETGKVDMTMVKTEPIIDAQYFRELSEMPHTKNAQTGEPFSSNLTDRNIYLKLFDIDTESDIDDEIGKRTDLTSEGLTLPDNVIIIGTVNMDDTTHQFSRKVIDRAMTIEMNGGNLRNMFGGSKNLEYLPEEEQEKWQNAFTRKYVTADEVLEAHSDVAEKLIDKLPSRLEQINLALKGTPFEVSYRVLNELTIMVGVMLDEGLELDNAIAQSVNNILLMKILPRIEGDAEMFALSKEYKSKMGIPYNDRLEWLKELADIKETSSDTTSENGDAEEPANTSKEHQQTAKEKIQEMIDRLNNQEFTRFWP